MPKFRGTWSISSMERGSAKNGTAPILEAPNYEEYKKLVQKQIAAELRVPIDKVIVSGVMRA